MCRTINVGRRTDTVPKRVAHRHIGTSTQAHEPNEPNEPMPHTHDRDLSHAD